METDSTPEANMDTMEIKAEEQKKWAWETTLYVGSSTAKEKQEKTQ